MSNVRDCIATYGLQDVIDFREGNFEVVDLPESFFEAVVYRWGLMHMSNLEVLKKIHDLLVPGGRFAASVWSDKWCNKLANECHKERGSELFYMQYRDTRTILSS